MRGGNESGRDGSGRYRRRRPQRRDHRESGRRIAYSSVEQPSGAHAYLYADREADHHEYSDADAHPDRHTHGDADTYRHTDHDRDQYADCHQHSDDNGYGTRGSAPWRYVVGTVMRHPGSLRV